MSPPLFGVEIGVVAAVAGSIALIGSLTEIIKKWRGSLGKSRANTTLTIIDNSGNGIDVTIKASDSNAEAVQKIITVVRQHSSVDKSESSGSLSQ